MTTIPTDLADTIESARDRAKLDTTAKKLIRHKIILAEILRSCVEEFSGCDAKYIAERCITGDIHMDVISVDQDIPDADARVVGADTEDASQREGTVRYDLVFDAQLPESGEIIRFIINIEIQVDMEPGYPVVTRAVYYLARLISRQKGTVFTHSDYGKLRKVYSIWICPDPKRENRNTIVEYGFTQRKMIGHVREPKEHYDKMSAIIISLNDDNAEECSGIVRLLSVLLSTTETAEVRKQILKDEFNIPMTREIEQEVAEMCNLGMAVEMKGVRKGMQQGMQQGMQKGMQQGIRQTRLESIRSLVETLKVDARQAMEFLKIPESERGWYLEQL